LIRPLFFAGVLFAGAILANQPEPAVVDAVSDIYRPFPPDQQKLGGVIGGRLRANSEGFVERIADNSGNATDERTGALLDAAVFTFEYDHDPHVNAVMLRLAKKLIGSQAADGYFGSRASAGRWTEQDTAIQSAALLGLLNYYRVTGDQTAFSACTKLGDLLLKESHKRSGDEASVFAGALESMVQLFRYTDVNKYVDFCKTVAQAWLHTKPPELRVTDDNLAVLSGLVELYRVNGDSSIFKAPLEAWTEMHAAGFSLTGIPADDSGKDPQAFSACTTAAWLHLTENLFRMTGQAVYGEQVERTVYNQLFAGQDARTGAVLAPVAWSAKKEPANGSPCAASEVRALAKLPSVVWGRYGNGIAVNLYTDGRTIVRLHRRGTVQLYAETTYPASGAILLHIEPDHPVHFPLRLRVPDWTTNFTIDVGQDHLFGKPGDFVTINRAWKRGDTVKISMVMNARAIPGIREFSADVALARGPQILALGKTLNPEITDYDAVAVEPAASRTLQLSPLATSYAADWMGDQTYTVMGTYQGHPRKLVLVPFAEASNYRVWLAQSKSSAGAAGGG
jgi:DUF1680 family protein